MMKIDLNFKQIATTAILLVLVVVLFAVFVDLEEVVHQIRQADWRYLGLGVILYLAGLVAYAVRWKFLLNSRISDWHVWHASNAGHLLSLFLPLRAGEPSRIFLLNRWTSIKIPVIVSSIVIERLLEQVMRLAALGGLAVFGLGIPVSALSVLGAVAFLVLAFGFLLWIARHSQIVVDGWPRKLARLPWLGEDRARKWLSEIIEGLQPFNSFRKALTGLLLSTLTWSLFWGMHYLVFLSLGGDHSVQEALAISLGALGLAPPSSTTLPGIYHASIVGPLSALGFNGNLLTAYAVLLHLVQMLVLPVLGFWAFVHSPSLSFSSSTLPEDSD